MSAELETARAELMARQGAGARYDSEHAPAADLALARMGTAYFARKLNELDDADLWGPTLIEGRTRRYVIADVCYRARALTRLAGGEPDYESAAARDAELTLGETLPARALRHLFHHSEVHLNVVWRDLSDILWNKEVQLLEGQKMQMRETVRLRALHLWQASIDLGNGGRIKDVPPELRGDIND